MGNQNNSPQIQERIDPPQQTAKIDEKPIKNEQNINDQNQTKERFPEKQDQPDKSQHQISEKQLSEEKEQKEEKIQNEEQKMEEEESSQNIDSQIAQFIREMQEKELRISKKQQMQESIWKGVKSVKVPEKTNDTEPLPIIEKVNKDINLIVLEKVSEWSKQQKQLQRRRWNNLQNQRKKIYYEEMKRKQEIYHEKRRQQEQKKLQIIDRMREMEERRRHRQYLQMKMSNEKIKKNLQKQNPQLKHAELKNIHPKMLRENSFEKIKKGVSNREKLRILEELKDKEKIKKKQSEKLVGKRLSESEVIDQRNQRQRVGNKSIDVYYAH